MKNFRTYEIMTGILAGLFAVVIGMAIISVINIAPYFSFLLGCFLSLPIFIVAFGQGTLASLVALISATVVLIIVTNIYIAFGFMLLFFLPAVYASWLLGLARPAQKENSLIWYPLSSVIFHLTNFIALISSFIGLYVETHPSTSLIAKKITANIAQAMQQSQSLKEADIIAFRELLMTHAATLTAIVLTVYSLIFLIGNLYFSMITAQHMKWLKRPRDDWSKTLRLPISGLVIFIGVCIASMIELGLTLNLSARVFSTAYTVVISISGLAYLHNITKGINGRIIILSLVYIAILTVVFAPPISFMMLLMGIWAAIQYNFQSRNKLH
ncbi:membrane protein [Bartonella henselae]|uniref:DUF2232 domain-containing protein n=1 Tax=Bartonella henselae (strain ATCC 49882 / DSM 28221 / CCUG 30454 / Houston 1) TaxID=283166 RepID=A0A0H3M2Z0_BARHE|nr:hypothetical protein [Bartonella henselae]ATP12136.1 hypothetical protein BhenCHDE101_02745 [Bartonella henselae]ETS09910.1 hypothetical protein Q654_00188 [Bartonella henselae JK 50]ETS10420.1 hypothetical protein Q655_00139 [Bartonella henselae JK 51]MDM9990186.1 hypothetical protein [Bartonella henselae]OLL40016.1 hypothetical protein AT244_00980 [Bartonella henselae]